MYCVKYDTLPSFFLIFSKTFVFQKNAKVQRLIAKKYDIMTFYRKKDGNRTYGFETNMISFYQVKIPCFKRNVKKSM